MRIPLAIPILFAAICMVAMTAGCVGTGDPESVDTVDRSWGLYERDVNGGLAAAEAEGLVADLTDRYSKATAPEDPGDEADEAARASYDAQVAVWEVDVQFFEEDLRRLVTDELSVAVAEDFFRNALRYELSKFPKGDAPDVEHDAGPADDP